MPSTVIVTRRMLRTVTRRGSQVLRVMIVLSLWHAPIPWVHAHDLEGPAVDRLGMLSQHVAEFHAREVSLGAQRLEWHTHLILPWCLVHHFPCPDSDEREPGADDFFGGVKVTAAGMNSGEAIGAPTARAFLADDLVSDLAARLPHAASASQLILSARPVGTSLIRMGRLLSAISWASVSAETGQFSARDSHRSCAP